MKKRPLLNVVSPLVAIIDLPLDILISAADKVPVVNKWLARSWIEDGEEELFFLVESREMLDDVATYYNLPVPYDDGLKTILDNDLKSIRLKSVDLNHEGEGNFVAVVVAGIVFEDNVTTKIRLYKTSRWNE